MQFIFHMVINYEIIIFLYNYKNYHLLNSIGGYMIDIIGGCYFTPNGDIPEAVVTNLLKIGSIAKNSSFFVYFWTDLSKLNLKLKKKLVDEGIIVQDYRELKTTFNEVLAKFIEKGHMGDKCAYALASDIFRVAYSEVLAEEQIFVYIDLNDIEFLDLNNDLFYLRDKFKKNPWGLSFPINIFNTDSSGKITLVELRNDCLIMRKSNNPSFFERFIKNYRTTLLQREHSYITPENYNQAKKQADGISCFISSIPIEIDQDLGTVYMVNAKEQAKVEEIDFSKYIAVQRMFEHGNQWHAGDVEAELELIKKALNEDSSISEEIKSKTLFYLREGIKNHKTASFFELSQQQNINANHEDQNKSQLLNSPRKLYK